MKLERLEPRNLLAVDSLNFRDGNSMWFHPDVDGDNLPEIVSADFGLGTAAHVAFSTEPTVQRATTQNMPLSCDEFGDCFYAAALSRGPADFDGDTIDDIFVSTGSIGEQALLSAGRPTETDETLDTVSIPGLYVAATLTGERSVIMRAYNNTGTASSGEQDFWFGYVDGQLKHGFPDADGKTFDPNNDGVEDRIAMYGFYDWRIVFQEPSQSFVANYAGGGITLDGNSELSQFANQPGMIAAWVSLQDANEWNSIVRTLCNDEASFMCAQFGPTTGIELQINEGQVFGTVTGYRNNVFASQTVPTGQWTHIAMTWDSQGNNIIHVNGEPSEPSSHGNGLNNSPEQWALGTDPLDLQAEDEPEGRAIRGEISDLIFASGDNFNVLEIMNDTRPVDPFTETKTAIPGHAYHALVDLNGDGHNELLVDELIYFFDESGTQSMTFEAAQIAFGLDSEVSQYYSGTTKIDYNGDGLEDFADVEPGVPTNVRIVFGPINPADADDSGQVDFADFLIVSANFGTNVGQEGRRFGDLDGDSQVSFDDFLVLSSEFGKTHRTL